MCHIVINFSTVDSHAHPFSRNKHNNQEIFTYKRKGGHKFQRDWSLSTKLSPSCFWTHLPSLSFSPAERMAPTPHLLMAQWARWQVFIWINIKTNVIFSCLFFLVTSVFQGKADCGITDMFFRCCILCSVFKD